MKKLFRTFVDLDAPAVTNCLIALDHFTEDNGATHVALGSQTWKEIRDPEKTEEVRVIMDRGSAFLLGGDVVHGGGANNTERRRRATGINYCYGWLRPMENHLLNVSLEQAASLDPRVQKVLGFSLYDIKAVPNASGLGYFRDYQNPSVAPTGNRSG